MWLGKLLYIRTTVQHDPHLLRGFWFMRVRFQVTMKWSAGYTKRALPEIDETCPSYPVVTLVLRVTLPHLPTSKLAPVVDTRPVPNLVGALNYCTPGPTLGAATRGRS